jgi:hypothetical protein
MSRIEHDENAGQDRRHTIDLSLYIGVTNMSSPLNAVLSASRVLLVCGAVTFLAACGTTSSLQSAEQDKTIDLTRYSKLIVEDFRDEATVKAKPEVQPILRLKLETAVKAFPDQIAAVTRSNGGFDQVGRSGTPDADTLVMRGAITQYDEGNATLRWMVGFAAGNVNFDAIVELLDGGTGQSLGKWVVDKNSWALGGGIAATQTPEGFMQEAATKIGTQLSEKRKAGSVKQPQS